mgnify:CR=1 FL=1
MGLFIHFYIIFGTNLLTGGPAQIAFFCLFQCFAKKNIKRIPNGMKPSGAWFLEQTWPRGLGADVKKPTRKPWGRGCAYPLGAPSTLVGPSWLHRPTSSSYICPHTPKISRSTRNPISTAATFCTQEIPSWGLFGAQLEGALITEGLYINSVAPPMMCE